MRRRSRRARASAEWGASPRHCRVESVDPPPTDVVSKIFESAHTIAVVGLSPDPRRRSEEHTSELQSRENLVCRLLLEKKKKQSTSDYDPTSQAIPIPAI